MNHSLLVVAGAVLLLIAKESNAAVIFTETLGTVSGTTAISSHESVNGFDNDGFTMSGTGDLRATTASSGYAGASGGANVFFTSSVSAGFLMSGISTSGHTAGSLDISFGAHKDATASNMTDLKFSYSTNGTTFIEIAIPAQPIGDGTTGWRLISLTDTVLPISNSLTLKWEKLGITTSAFRIDDIKLEGTAIPEPTTAALLCASLGIVLRRRRA